MKFKFFYGNFTDLDGIVYNNENPNWRVRIMAAVDQ